MRRFQIHLSTAVVLMFVAGGLIYLNTKSTPQREWTYRGNRVTRSGHDYGFPLPCISLGKNTFYADSANKVELKHDRIVDIDWTRALIDLALNLAILIYAKYFWERGIWKWWLWVCRSHM